MAEDLSDRSRPGFMTVLVTVVVALAIAINVYWVELLQLLGFN